MFIRSLFSHTPITFRYARGLGLLAATAIATTLSLSSVSVTAQEIVAEASKASKPTKLFSSRIQLNLPNTAGKPTKVSASLYSIRPKATDQKFVIFVTKEPLRKDEVKKSNKELRGSVKQLLEAQGYEIISLAQNGTTYTANFRAFTNVPWQQVGTTATRGVARFIRTKDDQLIGSILLCDPNQWSDSKVTPFKKTVTTAKIQSK